MAAWLISAPIDPAPADLKPLVPHGEHLAYEPKMDGFRGIGYARGRRNTLIHSKSGGDMTRVFPPVARDLEGLPENLVLDGEIVAYNTKESRFDRGELQHMLNRNRQHDGILIFYMVFDVLCAPGPGDVRGWTCAERRALLEGFTPHLAPLHSINLMDRYYDRDIAMKELRRLSTQIEGLVAKDVRAPYGAPGAWIKYRIAEGNEKL